MGLRADLDRLASETRGGRRPPRRGLVWVVTFLTTFVVVSYLTRNWDAQKPARDAAAQRDVASEAEKKSEPRVEPERAAETPRASVEAGRENRGEEGTSAEPESDGEVRNAQRSPESNTGDSLPDSTNRPRGRDPGSVEARPPPLEGLGKPWRSPGGLVYGPGSAEGHRLRHVARHLEDDGDRPVHGVFNGGLEQAVKVIDQAYQWHLAGDRRATSREDRQRTVIEARFDQPIGYVGGEQGADDGFPKASRLRLVVEGDAVITAFPIR